MVVVLGTCALINWQGSQGVLPKSIEVDRVTYARQTAGFREGCIYAAYKLKTSTARRLRKDGLAALDNAYPGEGQYGDWAATPLELGGEYRNQIRDGERWASLHALGARDGCGGGRKRRLDVVEMLGRPGNFYTVNSNNEGLIVIDPNAAVAVFLYFG